jgi:hypothetical protein
MTIRLAKSDLPQNQCRVHLDSHSCHCLRPEVPGSRLKSRTTVGSKPFHTHPTRAASFTTTSPFYDTIEIMNTKDAQSCIPPCVAITEFLRISTAFPQATERKCSRLDERTEAIRFCSMKTWLELVMTTMDGTPDCSLLAKFISRQNP